MALIYRHWFPCTVTAENPHGKGYTGYTYRSLKERDKDRFCPSAANDSVGLKRAIAKYGKENMQTDIIQVGIIHHEILLTREKYWIRHFDDYHNGCNRTIGGNGTGAGENHPNFGRTGERGTNYGNRWTEEQRKKQSERFSGENHYMFGKKHTPETIAKMSGENSAMFGKKGKDHPMFGKGHLISGQKHGMFGRTGKKNPMFDKRHTPEAKAKFSGEKNGMFGKGHLISGEKNGMFGRTRPEYVQARWFFFLEIAPMQASTTEKRNQFHQAFESVPRWTRNNWLRKWNAELKNE